MRNAENLSPKLLLRPFHYHVMLHKPADGYPTVLTLKDQTKTRRAKDISSHFNSTRASARTEISLPSSSVLLSSVIARIASSFVENCTTPQPRDRDPATSSSALTTFPTPSACFFSVSLVVAASRFETKTLSCCPFSNLSLLRPSLRPSFAYLRVPLAPTMMTRRGRHRRQYSCRPVRCLH